MQMDAFVILEPSGDHVESLASVTSSAAIVIGTRKKFILTVDGDFNIKRGLVGVGAAAATDGLMTAGSYTMMSASKAWDRIRIYNPNGSAVSISVIFLMNS